MAVRLMHYSCTNGIWLTIMSRTGQLATFAKTVWRGWPRLHVDRRHAVPVDEVANVPPPLGASGLQTLCRHVLRCNSNRASAHSMHD
jgi:hypothetical protein